jgi:hypothetical protein
MRPIATHHQSRYSNGAVDAALLMASQIKHDEEITRKEWRLDRAQFPRVADNLMPFRLKRSELRSLKLTLCARLGEGQSVHAYHRSLSESVVGCACAGLYCWSGQNCSLHVGEAPV